MYRRGMIFAVRNPRVNMTDCLLSRIEQHVSGIYHLLRTRDNSVAQGRFSGLRTGIPVAFGVNSNPTLLKTKSVDTNNACSANMSAAGQQGPYYMGGRITELARQNVMMPKGELFASGQNRVATFPNLFAGNQIVRKGNPVVFMLKHNRLAPLDAAYFQRSAEANNPQPNKCSAKGTSAKPMQPPPNSYEGTFRSRI